MQPHQEPREAARQAALEYFGAVKPDPCLQEIVDEIRGIFGVALCTVNLVLPRFQYFRA